MNRVYAALLMLGIVLCWIASHTSPRYPNIDVAFTSLGVVLIIVAVILIATDTSW
jgi:hypothetical protein